MDVATLGIEVTQKGVTATATALGKLAEQSVKVTTSVAALQGVLTTLSSTNLTNSSVSIRQLAEALVTLSRAMQTIEATSKSFGRVTTSITSLSTAAEKLNMSSAQFSSIDANLKGLQSTLANMQGVSTPISNLRAEISNLQNNIKNLKTSADAGINLSVKTGNRVVSPASASGGVDGNKIKSEAEKAENSLYRLGRTAATVRNTVFNLFAFGGATALVGATVKLADEMTLLDARIKLVSKDTADFVRIQQGLLQIANSSGQSIQDATANYARMARSTEGMGISSDRLLKVSDGLSKAMVVGGESAGSFNQAMIQLNQGLASGVLRGQELNSVSEQSSQVFKALQIGLGKSAGELRKFAKDGKLTSEVVIQALEKGLPEVTKQFDALPLTVERASNMLKNNFSVALNEVNKSGEYTTNLAKSIRNLANSFAEVTPYAIKFASVLPEIAGAAVLIGLGKLGQILVSNGASMVASATAARAKAQADLQAARAAEASALAEMNKARALAAGGMASTSAVAAERAYAAAQVQTQAAMRATTVSAQAVGTAVSLANKAFMAVGGIPTLIFGAIMLIVSYWEQIKVAIMGASAAHDDYMKRQKAMSTANTGVEIRNEINAQTAHLEGLKKQRASIEQKMSEGGVQSGRAKSLGVGPTAQALAKEKDTLTDQIRETSLALDRLENVRKARNKIVAEETRAEIDKANEKPTLREPIDEKAQKEAEREAKRQAKLAETLGVKESKVEASIETYKRNIEILKQGGTVQEQLNKHETNAIQLADQLNDVHDKQKIASLQRRIAMEKEAGALLRQNESLEEYVKLSKESKIAAQESLQSLADESAIRNLNADANAKILNDLKEEIDLRKQLASIYNNDKLNKEEKQKLAQQKVDESKARKNAFSPEGGYGFVGAGTGFENQDFIKQEQERQLAMENDTYQKRLDSINQFYSQKVGLEEAQRAAEKTAAEAHASAIAQIQQNMYQAQLQNANMMLQSTGSVLGKFSDLLKEAGLENSALSKAVFIAQKAIAIGQAIVNTELAATQALAYGGPAGPAMASAVRALGYTSVAIMTATSIMEAKNKFAKGAAFQGGNVVSTPTYFPMSGGKTGLMGEAGAEAVMPLSRAPDGSLGVRMDGGGGKSVVVNTPISISIESTGGDDKSTAQQTANAVRAAVLTIIQKEKMPGGSLYSR